MATSTVTSEALRAPRTVPELGMLGRALVLLATAPGLLFGAVTGFGLLWFVPYAGTGALLAIRRPRTPIGWLLLVLGWLLVIAALTTADPTALLGEHSAMLDELLAFLAEAVWPVVFGLFTILAAFLPDGRLPAGRWRTAALVTIALTVLMVIVAATVPALSDILIAPVAVLLAASAASLFVRRARATGVERQQLRWIVASIVLVLIAFVVSSVLAFTVPGADDSGAAWLPTALAFPTVPIAIGIAVLRYHLYQIDTIISRAIVYGLLTAILAGGTSAVIAVAQKLFAGVVGPGSDATIVLTTLVVVAAFDPVKKFLQGIVDRRYRFVPETAFDALVKELHTTPSELSVERTLRRFLAVAMDAFGAQGGQVDIGDGAEHRSIRAGDTTAGVTATASAPNGDRVATVRLHGRMHERADPDLLETALTRVLAELGSQGAAAR